MAQDCIVAIQDMGAAGLTSSSFEMAARGECGIELDLTLVPLREAGMSAYEIMLSESQERMLMVLKEGREDEARRVFEKWGLDFAVVGRVTDTGRMVVRYQGETVADLPVAPVSGASPVYERPYEPPAPPARSAAADPPVPTRDALLRLVGSPDLASKRWIWEQYDHTVMADTVQRPGGDAAVVRVHGTTKGLVLTTDCTPRYCAADPVTGGRQAVAEAWRNLVATGATPLAITDCLNFGNPERPAVMGQIVGCIEGMAEACRALDFPVVSGNVSLYNETSGTAILPTPEVGGLGLIPDLARMAGIALPAEHLSLVLIGDTAGWLDRSLCRAVLHGREDGPPPPVDLDVERRNGELVLRLIRDGVVRACHDLSDGGLLVALAEMCLAGRIGATLLPPPEVTDQTAWLFGEDQARYVLAVAPEDLRDVMAAAHMAAVPAREVGTSGGDALIVGDEPPIWLSELEAAREGWLPVYMEGEAA
jgi:phosphoribosylformylglycinamidine synthase